VKKLWEFLKRSWKVLLVILGAVAAAILAERIVGTARAFLSDRTFNPARFKKLDDRHIAVRTEAGWRSVDVSVVGLRPDQVAAVEVCNGGPVKVVRKNESIDEV
jgi:hypothetical protein